MKYEDLVEYFELYVEEYKPHKDDKLYKGIVSFLHGYYFKHSYETIPEAFKTAFEGQKIPPEFYDILLLSNGFPKSLLEKLQFSDKFILLSSLMDYNIYKGTVKCFQKVAANFNNNLNIYELFLDYRNIAGETSQPVYDWVFVPYPIFIDPDMKKQELKETFEFDRIYNGTPHFFVNRDQLNEMRERDDLLLPLKTNLILLDQTLVEKVSPLLSLYFSITLAHFKNERMILYFEEGQYSINLERLYKLWYYIIFKWYGKDPTKFTTPSPANLLSIDKAGVAYDITDIDAIQAEYDNLSFIAPDSGEKIRLFYKEKIEDVFNQFHTTPKEYTQDEWTNIFKEELGKSLIEYVDGRIDNIGVGGDVTVETNKLLSDIYNSVVTWSVVSDDPDVTKYFHHFLDMLSLLMVQPEDTPSFMVMNFLKPFHVEMTGQGRIKHEVNDKFNSVLMDEQLDFVVKMARASLNNMSHHLFYNQRLPVMDSQQILQDVTFATNKYVETMSAILDEHSSITTSRKALLQNFSYNEIMKLYGELKTNIHIFDDAPLFRDIGKFSLFETEDLFQHIVKLPKMSIENIFDFYTFEMTPSKAYDNLHIFSEIPTFKELFWRYFGEIEYIYSFNSIYIDNTITEIANNYNYIIEKEPDYDDFIMDIYAWYRQRFFVPIDIEYQYIFDIKISDMTIENIINNYNYITKKEADYDNVDIDVYAWWRQRFFKPLDIEYIYSFELVMPIETSVNISNDYNHIIKLYPHYDNMDIDVYAWWRQRFFKFLNISYIYNFDTSSENHTLAEMIDNYNYVTKKVPDYDNMDISIDKIFKERVFETIYNSYLYRFDSKIVETMIIGMLSICNFVIRKNPEYDSVQIFIDCPSQRSGNYDFFDVDTDMWSYKYFPVVAVEEFINIDYEYRFKTIKDEDKSINISHSFNVFEI
jgi:hypothetical protein